MSSKVWSIGILKHTIIIQHHVYIGSTDQFNQVGVHEKNDRNDFYSVDAHRGLVVHSRNLILIYQ